jgi:hypothetical protein
MRRFPQITGNIGGILDGQQHLLASSGGDAASVGHLLAVQSACATPLALPRKIETDPTHLGFDFLTVQPVAGVPLLAHYDGGTTLWDPQTKRTFAHSARPRTPLVTTPAPSGARQTLDRDLQLSALHEAGHCVIYFTFGYRIQYARLTSSGGGWTGMNCDEYELNTFARITAILAGEIAEELLAGHIEVRDTPDRALAMKIAARINKDEASFIVDAARQQARRLVRHHADAIRMLAQILRARGELEGSTIVTMLLHHQQRRRRAAWQMTRYVIYVTC